MLQPWMINLIRDFGIRRFRAFSASDRAMIDVLTVLELKADEDIHLPLQGIDYWARVAWHHARGEFHKFRYFAGRELAGSAVVDHGGACVARASCDGHIAAIEWTLLGIDERWRKGLRVVFRKRPVNIG
jgi:hypothetical protein